MRFVLIVMALLFCCSLVCCSQRGCPTDDTREPSPCSPCHAPVHRSTPRMPPGIPPLRLDLSGAQDAGADQQDGGVVDDGGDGGA